MLVSARADAEMRRDVEEGVRPRPEFLVLESRYGVELLDWTRVPGSRRGRSRLQSALHVAAALPRVAHHEVVFSDGEHLGIPLALAMRSLGITTPHLVIGHHLTTRTKARLLRRLRLYEGMTRILVHSSRQHDLAHRTLGVPASKLAFVPYYADTDFWRPLDVPEQALIVAAGREHRDYLTMAAACSGLDAKVFVAAGSVHSPSAGVVSPERWPVNFEVGFAGYTELRDLYGRASVVVVPVVDTDFQAGVTTLLEAMAMGKAVITTGASAQGDIVRHGVSGICVPPGDAREMRSAVAYLLGDDNARRTLGAAARQAVLTGYSVETYSARLAEHLMDLAAAAPAAA